MISFAGITPNSPILLQKNIKNNLEKTKTALSDLEKKIDEANLDSLIIISSNKKMHMDAFGILLEEKYNTEFKEFGDFETKQELFPDLEIIEKIRHVAIDNEIKLNLIHKKNIDYNFSVPLYFLLNNKNIKIIPIVSSFLNLKIHYEVGKLIKKTIINSNKRIGIIASGNLSNKSTEKSPIGFSPKAKQFNEKFKEILQSKSSSALLSLDPKLIKIAQEDILPSTAMLMGIIDKINYKTQIFSWEAPFGIGYTVTNFKIL